MAITGFSQNDDLTKCAAHEGDFVCAEEPAGGTWRLKSRQGDTVTKLLKPIRLCLIHQEELSKKLGLIELTFLVEGNLENLETKK